MPNINFIGYKCAMSFGKYRDGSTAIKLRDAVTGEPIAIATVCVDSPPPDGFVWIKDWSENEGMVESLAEAGVIAPECEMEFPTGFVTAKLHKLLISAV